MTPRRLPGPILALTPGDVGASDLPGLVGRVRAAAALGLDSILVREPALGDRATCELARALRAILGPAGWLGIHDRVHLAGLVRADGVHLGFRSLPIRVARAICPAGIAIGFSSHAHDEPGSADGADYQFFGPVFDTESKSGLLEATGVDGLARGVQSTSIPVWALGGVTPRSAASLAITGVRGLAVRGGLLGARDPAAAWTELVAAWRSGAGPTRVA